MPAWDLIEPLLKKSQGVWIYTRYILDEIKDGRRSVINLNVSSERNDPVLRGARGGVAREPREELGLVW